MNVNERSKLKNNTSKTYRKVENEIRFLLHRTPAQHNVDETEEIRYHCWWMLLSCRQALSMAGFAFIFVAYLVQHRHLL